MNNLPNSMTVTPREWGEETDYSVDDLLIELDRIGFFPADLKRAHISKRIWQFKIDFSFHYNKSEEMHVIDHISVTDDGDNLTNEALQRVKETIEELLDLAMYHEDVFETLSNIIK